LAACLLCAAASVVVVPRGIEAQSLLRIEDDPGLIADRALDGHFDAAIAAREIHAALDANDPDLAGSFDALAAERHVAVDSALVAKVDAAVSEAASTAHAMESFAQGLITGEPSDGAGIAGMAVGDLFVLGDIRDAAREGARLASGQEADELVLGLACVGLAITAGTYASLGIAAPLRVGVSLAKAARKTGRLGAGLSASIGRALRQMIDWNKLKGAFAGASLAEPAVAIRAAREAIKVERAGGLMHLIRDVGRVQSKAGTRAALDGLKIAETPREMSRLARLAAAKGRKTRAILKVIGRGAIVLTVAAFDLGLWMLGALLALFGFVASLKSMVERITERVLRRKRERRLGLRGRGFAPLAVRG
jgi:hypothetical protein